MRYIFLLIALPFLFFSCKKDPNVLFEMAYPNNDFSIAAGLNPFDVHYFILRNIQTNSDSLFSFHNIKASAITQIQPSSARLSAIFASSDYSFIRKIEIRIFKDNPDDYNVLFYRDDVPFNTGQDLGLIPNGVNIKKYMVEDHFGIVVRMELRNISPEFIESRLNFKFGVQ